MLSLTQGQKYETSNENKNSQLSNSLMKGSISVTVLSQKFTPVSTHSFFICFVVHFLFSMHIAFSFQLWYFYIFSWSTHMFPFFNYPTSFISAPNFKHSWLETINIFCHSPLQIAFLNEFCYPFNCFTLLFFCGSHVSIQLSLLN